MAIGISLALRIKNNSRRVFALIGDGECNEGSIWESVLLAGNMHLSQLTCIVINNHSSSIRLGDLAAKFIAFEWDATTIDGRSHDAIYNALRHTNTTRPTAVIAEIGKER
jgi:transketolase